MRCHYIRVEREKIFIPGCMGGAVYGPKGCTCYPDGEDEFKVTCSSLADDVTYCSERVVEYEDAIIKLKKQLQDLIKEKEELIELVSELEKKLINGQEKK